MIQIVNKKTHKPEECDYYIGRGSVLGNPFTHLRNGTTKATYVVDTRDEAIASYEQYIRDALSRNDSAFLNALNEIILIEQRYGKVNLVCYCAPLPCHGNIIAKILQQN